MFMFDENNCFNHSITQSLFQSGSLSYVVPQLTLEHQIAKFNFK